MSDANTTPETPATPADDKKAKKAAANKRYREKKKQTKGTPTPTPAVDPNNLSAVMLTYDIPSAVDYPNPSGELRKIGFRSNLSCWVIPEGMLPLTLIHELRTKGHADVDIVKFDASEGPRLARLAVRNTRKELEEQIKRTRENLAKWEANFLKDGEENTEERKDAHARYVSRCASILRRLKLLADDLDQAVRNFGVDPAQIGMVDARRSFDLMQAGVAKRAEAYVKATNALKGAGTADAALLAKAAGQDQAAHYAMADALREAGDEKAADDLQAAFDAKPEEEGDGTFSLVGEDAT